MEFNALTTLTGTLQWSFDMSEKPHVFLIGLT